MSGMRLSAAFAAMTVSLVFVTASAPASSQSSGSTSQPVAAETPPSVPTVASIDGIGPVGEWQRIDGDYVLSEAPVAGSGGDFYFGDFRAGGVFLVAAGGHEVSLFLPDIHVGGLGFDGSGRLIALEGREGAVFAFDPVTLERTVLADGIDGQRFNAPNDLVFDSHGGFYFSDPENGAPLPLPQGKQSIYYISAGGDLSRVVDYLPRPNGVALSPDGSELYVALSGNTEILCYSIDAPGHAVRNSGRFANTAFLPPPGRGQGAVTGTDGLKVDAAGNVYAATRFGIEIFSPQGRSLGIIETPERPSNFAFGGEDGRTLLVTTYRSAYVVRMAMPGAGFPQ